MDVFRLPHVEHDVFSDLEELLLGVVGVLRPELPDVDPVGVFLPEAVTIPVGVFLPVVGPDTEPMGGFLSVEETKEGVFLPVVGDAIPTHSESADPAHVLDFKGCLVVGGTGKCLPLVVPDTPPAVIALCMAPLPPGMMAALPMTMPLGPFTTLTGSLEADFVVCTVVLAVLIFTSLTAGTNGRHLTVADGGVSGSTVFNGGADVKVCGGLGGGLCVLLVCWGLGG